MLNVNNSHKFALQLHPEAVNWIHRWQEQRALLAFVLLSMLVQISVGQEESISRASILYWLLIIPALFLPLFHAPRLFSFLIGSHGILLLAFGALASAWHLVRGDVTAVSHVFLFVWITAWIAVNQAPLTVRNLARLYVALVIIGALISYFTSLNVWGLLPGSTRADYGVWRVSFFPNIANTGILSLFMVLLLTRDKATMLRHPVALLLSLYFLAFSFVRTAQIAALVYLAMRFWFYLIQAKRKDDKKSLLLSAMLVAVLMHVFIVTAPLVLHYLQDIPLVSRLFLRGEDGLSTEEIFVQAYRPWLWLQHFHLFLTSPGLMGLGTFQFDQLIQDSLLPEHVNTGSESLPTRLLASFGIPFLFFVGFILRNLKKNADRRDIWACACFPPVILLMMNWGSVFHPTNAFFALFFLILLHGSNGFWENTEIPVHGNSFSLKHD